MKIKLALLFSLFSLAIVSLSSCTTTETLYGSYTEQYGTKTFTTNVVVKIKGDTIVKVEFEEDSNHYSDPTEWPNASIWQDNEQNVLKSLEGRTISNVKNWSTKELYGQETYDSISGASYTANRLHQAILDAIKDK